MMKLYCEKFGAIVVNDMVKILLGKKIGRGVYRTVFDCVLDPSCVVKVADRKTIENFSNSTEWMVWNHIKDSKYKKWFCPVVRISDDGHVLIQKKTTVVTVAELKEVYPKVPDFFTDLKASNWGWLNGQIVCHDYGNNLLLEVGMTSRMKKADWWE